MEAINTRNLSKSFKSLGKGKIHSLDDLNLQVGEGEVFGFLGRNGAGKTTTIKLLCSLLKPSSGSAEIFGEDVRKRPTRRLLGYLPEQPYFYEYLTPRETIEFYGKLRGLSAKEQREQWEVLSERLELKAIADRRIKTFSKGMRQRIGFAVALVGDPPLLILDEPMSGLDPVGRRNIRELMLLCRDQKKTLFFSSHVLADVELICDRIGILVEGRLTQQGRLDELLGGHMDQMELIVAGVPEDALPRVTALAERHRRLEGTVILTMRNREAANSAIQLAQTAGGEVLELSAIKVRLEDYFMEEQARHESIRQEQP